MTTKCHRYITHHQWMSQQQPETGAKFFQVLRLSYSRKMEKISARQLTAHPCPNFFSWQPRMCGKKRLGEEYLFTPMSHLFHLRFLRPAGGSDVRIGGRKCRKVSALFLASHRFFPTLQHSNRYRLHHRMASYVVWSSLLQYRCSLLPSSLPPIIVLPILVSYPGRWHKFRYLLWWKYKRFSGARFLCRISSIPSVVVSVGIVIIGGIVRSVVSFFRSSFSWNHVEGCGSFCKEVGRM